MISRIWHSGTRRRLQDRLILRVGRELEYLAELYRSLKCRRLVEKLGKCGNRAHIVAPVTITAPEKIAIGDNAHIQKNAFIRAEAGLKIGDNTHISRNLVLYTINHNYEGVLLPYDNELICKPVEIGRNVWIGMNVCIAPGVTIGEGAIIGMGTVVSGDVPPFAIIGAAKWCILKYRDREHYQVLEENRQYGGVGGLPLK